MTTSGVLIFQLCKSNGGYILALVVFLLLVITILGWVTNSIVTSIFGAVLLAITAMTIFLYAVIKNLCLNLCWTETSHYQDPESILPSTDAECVKTSLIEQTNSPLPITIEVDETIPSN